VSAFRPPFCSASATAFFSQAHHFGDLCDHLNSQAHSVSLRNHKIELQSVDLPEDYRIHSTRISNLGGECRLLRGWLST
jgi:hypothetical protein